MTAATQGLPHMAGPVPGAQDNPASPGGSHGLDANVVASAVATRGLCSDVLRSVIESHSLVLSETVFRELRRVLLRKFGVPRGTVEAAETFLREEGEIIREAAAVAAGPKTASVMMLPAA